MSYPAILVKKGLLSFFIFINLSCLLSIFSSGYLGGDVSGIPLTLAKHIVLFYILFNFLIFYLILFLPNFSFLYKLQTIKAAAIPVTSIKSLQQQGLQ